MKNDNNELVTIKGLVVPTKWDSDGNITGIAVAGYNEMTFPILMNEIGRSLKALLHEKVVIDGMKIKLNNMDVMEVKRFNKDLL